MSVLIPPDLQASATSLARHCAWQPDTVWLAAWGLLMRRWCGHQALRWAEASDPESTRCCPIDDTQSAHGWVAAVDAARTAPEVGDAEIAQSDRLVWAGNASTLAGAAHPVLGLSREVNDSALWLELDEAVFDSATAMAILECLVWTAQGLVQAGASRLGDIDTLAPAQHRQQFDDWNRPARRSPDSPPTIHAAFARSVAVHGALPAVAHRGSRIDYRGLDQRAAAMTERLVAAGVLSGSVVCVALDRSIDAIVVLLGVLRAGAAYLPVDPQYPASRLNFMIEDAGAVLVVTCERDKDRFPQAVPILSIDVPSAAPVESRRVRSTAGETGAASACVMYTSGSTGEPKGICIPHAAVLRLVLEAEYVDLGRGETVLHAAPLGFDASTFEIWGPLLNGGCCVLHDEVLATPAGLARTIRRERVRTAWLTAALFNSVVDADPQHLAGLRQLLIGGEALSVGHVRRALQAWPDLILINGYGPTETTTFAATYRIPHEVPADTRSIPIGRPITATRTHVLGPRLTPLATGLIGELFIGGHGLALGYLQRPELTAERFVADPFGQPGERLYRTGDLVRYGHDGHLEFIGRADGQVKLHGHRIELGEVEARLASNAAIRACSVQLMDDAMGAPRLVAYLVAAGARPTTAELNAHLAAALPAYMLPSAQVWLDALPITANGKLDRRALPAPATERPDLANAYLEPVGAVEQSLCTAFASILGIDRCGRHDNFFELGGDSLRVLRLLARLEHDGVGALSTASFFRLPTPAGLARALAPASAALADEAAPARPSAGADVPIAIVAMSGRFPGAADVEQFWQNLCEGRDSITMFADDELDPSLPASLTGDPLYVKARGVMDGVELFDAGFFGMSPREAEAMDPQQRLFLELCWECLERGGHAPGAAGSQVGVFAGMYNASYFSRHVSHHPDAIDKLGEFQVMLANEKDYIAARVAWRLNLTGPAISVHTACSTSLVAIAQACASLRSGQCDMALAGGASIVCPPRSGYLYQEGAMLSPDGRTRSFDARAQGTVFSDGAAVVLLKRLPDALADGDAVIAVLRGEAINNDGRDKASFTAPSVDGQAAVIVAAQRAAGVDARSVSYVEAHGTATPMGDPVELEALIRAFRRTTLDPGFCRIGSLKSNVGHLVIAAGAAGVIKTALALAEERLPPSIHFETPNPRIPFAGSPFVVNDGLTGWPRGAEPRRAGVSSFGVGGTNAHVVLEEAPLRAASSPSAGPQLLLLSARSAPALAAMAARLGDHLEADPATNLADAAHTLQIGRSRFMHRLAVVAESPAAAVAALRDLTSPHRVTRTMPTAQPALAWLLPGQGAQYARMGAGLRASDGAFRAALDECLAVLAPHLRFDLAALLAADDGETLTPTGVAQPAMFAIQYALGRTWMAQGAAPALLIGHSVGEFAAAVFAGVMSLVDAAGLVAARGTLMQALPGGSMLSVRLSGEVLAPMLPADVSLAAENGPNASVASGPTASIEALAATLETRGIASRVLHTSHAFHSSMMDLAVAPFERAVRAVTLHAPRIPIVSTLTGTWLTDAEATDPNYWARHLRDTVRFSSALTTALQRGATAFLEVGPRQTLTLLARQHAARAGSAPPACASLGNAPADEAGGFALARGALWTLGFDLSACAASPAQGRRRIRLPTYPFERKRHWLDARPAAAAAANPPAAPAVLAAASAVATSSPSSSPSLPMHDPAPSPITQVPVMTTTATSSTRFAAVSARLRRAFEDVTGADLAEVDGSAAFVELGLDSLSLTQAATQVKKEFGVPVTFRQLMENLRSFDALGHYIADRLPEAPPAPAAALAAPALTTPALAISITGAAPQDFLQQLVQQQMQLMAQQLALLGAHGRTAPQDAAPLVASLLAAAAPPASPSTPAEPEAAAVRYDVKTAFGAIARIHTQATAVSERQHARLDAFVRRYVERTKASKAYTVANRARLADPRVVNGFRPMTKEITYQIVVERSKGSRLWDLDGNEYVDVLNGFGMNLFGWQPEFVQEAVRRQLDAGYEIGPQHPLAGEVASLICELTGFDRAALCNTGSEAVMAAVRIARTVTGRNTVVLFSGSYHGTFDEVLVRVGRDAKGIPAAPGILPGAFGDVRVLDYGSPAALEFIRAHADDLAAVLVEPVQSRRPDFRPVEFLKEVRAIASRSGTCLIFDEVITGFRAHLGGAQALFGVRADLACYGKVIGGGFPVGVVAGVRSFMDALDGGAWAYGDDSVPTVGVTYFAGTFVRHPLALAAAKASLEHLKTRQHALQTELNDSTAAMADEMSAFCREVGAPLEIRRFASLWRVTWLEEHPLQDLLFAMMRSRGVHILDNFPCFLTTAHSQADIRLVIEAFKESVRELQASEFLPCNKLAPSIVFDAAKPPVPGARLGKDPSGRPAWFVPSPQDPAKYLKVNA